MNTGLSGASPDDFQTSALVPSLDAQPLAPLQAVRLPLCSTFQKLLRTTGPSRLLRPGFSQRPFGDGQPDSKLEVEAVEDDAGQRETWLGYLLV